MSTGARCFVSLIPMISILMGLYSLWGWGIWQDLRERREKEK